MNQSNAAQAVILGFQRALTRIEAAEQELGQLDAAAGDGDHGSGMVRGLKAACAALPQENVDQKPGDLLTQAGATFADAAGGASGALVGMLFMGVGGALGDGPYSASSVARALRAGLDTLQQMGQAEVGDKTMVDTLVPFVHALGNNAAAGATASDAWQQALPAAQEGAASTTEMVAKRGRSARLGERSRGHLDPGAISMLYILQAFGEALAEACP